MFWHHELFFEEEDGKLEQYQDSQSGMIAVVSACLVAYGVQLPVTWNQNPCINAPNPIFTFHIDQVGDMESFEIALNETHLSIWIPVSSRTFQKPVPTRRSCFEGA